MFSSLPSLQLQLVELLSVRAPSPDVKLKLLKEIAEEHELDWDPAASETELLKPHEDLLVSNTCCCLYPTILSKPYKRISFARTDQRHLSVALHYPFPKRSMMSHFTLLQHKLPMYLPIQKQTLTHLIFLKFPMLYCVQVQVPSLLHRCFLSLPLHYQIAMTNKKNPLELMKINSTILTWSLNFRPKNVNPPLFQSSSCHSFLPHHYLLLLSP